MNQIFQHKAFILIEVLIAELLASLLGLFLLNAQWASLKMLQRIYDINLVIVRLTSLAEQFYIVNSSAARKQEYAQWNKENQLLLPNWQSSYSCQIDKCIIQMQIHSPYKETLRLNL